MQKLLINPDLRGALEIVFVTLMFLLIIAVYFFILKPVQAKKQKERAWPDEDFWDENSYN